MTARPAGQPDHQQVLLIVDDDPGNIDLLTAMLTADGFLFRTAASGSEALASIAQHRPDLVLLDYMMPDMDGQEVVRQIKADEATSGIPVIMVTALDDRKARISSLEAGAEDFLTKPVDRAELRVRVRNLLRLKALSDHFDSYGKSLENEVRVRTEALLTSEAALLEERDAAQRYLDTAQVFLVALDLAGRITLVNQYACSVLGWSADELIGRDWFDSCVPARIRTALLKRHREVLEGDDSTGENEVLTKSGEERLIEWRNTPLKDAFGHVNGLLSSGTDISDRSRAARTLLATEERTRFALETAGIGMWEVDFTTGRVRSSRAVETHYGVQPGTFRGTFDAAFDRIHPEDLEAVRAIVANTMRTGGDASVDYRTILEDGAVRWLSARGRVQLDEQGSPLRGMGIIQDITARRTLESQYQQSQKMEAVGRLAAGVAHDFNNLLTVISGFAEFVAASLSDNIQASGDVAEIIKAADRAAALTQQLLAFSRQQVLHTAPVDVNELVSGMSGMITRLIGADITVKLALRPGMCPALADRGQIEQVLMNLVVNARDAMPDGGSIVIETADVELDDSPFHDEHVQRGAYVMLAVTDTGTGMSKETQIRLFEPFYTTKKAGDGTGLGLSTSYGIIKQSNGHIWVYSEPGFGTTFKIYLPHSPDAHVAVAEPPPPPPAPAERVTETLLVVEDESSVRDLTTRILREAGYRVLIADNGADARLLFNRHPAGVDLVLTDVVMPGMGGPELLAHLHKENPALPVLYMSGYTEQSVATRAGFDRGIPFLQKPFTSAELLRCVRWALTGKSIAIPALA
ncbi:MAG: response regulator [Gemmatimonadaceae bacterium]|nr:response regulator [Gemmatimonadaceae bacterium]